MGISADPNSPKAAPYEFSASAHTPLSITLGEPCTSDARRNLPRHLDNVAHPVQVRRQVPILARVPLTQ